MSEDFKVQISLNAPPPAQYAKGAMANFRGETVKEVKGLLEDAKERALLELAAEVEAIWTAAAGLGANTVSVESSDQGASVTQFPKKVQAAPEPDVPSCKHGPRTYRSGNKGGKAWEAYFCPTPKGSSDQCAPVWVD